MAKVVVAKRTSKLSKKLRYEKRPVPAGIDCFLLQMKKLKFCKIAICNIQNMAETTHQDRTRNTQTMAVIKH